MCDKLAIKLSWQRFTPKVVNFQLPYLHLTCLTCIRRLRWGWPCLSFTEIFTVSKLESPRYRVACLYDPMFNKTLTCHRQAGRQMNRQTDTWKQSISVLSNVLRLKMYLENAYYNWMTLKVIQGHRQCKILWCSCVMLCWAVSIRGTSTCDWRTDG